MSDIDPAPSDNHPFIRGAAAKGYGLQRLIPLAGTLGLEQWFGSQFKACWLVMSTGDTVQKRALEQKPHSDNPIDETVVEELSLLLQNAAYKFVYPAETMISLLPILKHLGLHGHSLLFPDIHPQYGPWWAVRAAILVDVDPSSAPQTTFVSPCVTCPAPCIEACPGQAVLQSGWNAVQCMDYRLSNNSVCAQSCPARISCPVGPEYRYDPEIINYHYKRSLQSIIAYRDKSGAGN